MFSETNIVEHNKQLPANDSLNDTRYIILHSSVSTSDVMWRNIDFCIIFRPDTKKADFNEVQDSETLEDFQNLHANMHSKGTNSIMLKF